MSGDVLKIQVKALRWFVEAHCGGVEGIQDLSTGEVVATFIRPYVRRHEKCPPDGTNLAFLVWSEGLSSYGVYGPFISHSWGASFLELMETLESGLSAEQFIFIDILCLNIVAAVPADAHYFSSVFYSTIRECESVIMITQSCSDSQETTNCVHRLWCLLETWASVQTKASFQMLLTSSSRNAILADPNHWSRTLLSKPISIATAKVSDKQDHRVLILQIGDQEDAFNGWVEMTIRCELHRLLKELGVPVEEWTEPISKMKTKQLGVVVPPVSILESDLQRSCKSGNLAEVVELVNKGANLKGRDTDKNTPLHTASYGGHTKVVLFLLEKGADPTAKNEQGNTALHAAAFNGHATTAQKLVEKGADMKAKNDQGATPLHVAAQRGQYSSAGILLASGAPVNAMDDWGATPLDLARAGQEHRNTKQVQDLIKTHGGSSGKGCKCSIS
mmetsp:Transcript_48509/g.114545  ORF Transcript_48509/g.114545 Transcript_48509/m.114545 type:complete len:446 (+) Transcript_48509:78-1415(+)